MVVAVATGVSMVVMLISVVERLAVVAAGLVVLGLISVSAVAVTMLVAVVVAIAVVAAVTVVVAVAVLLVGNGVGNVDGVSFNVVSNLDNRSRMGDLHDRGSVNNRGRGSVDSMDRGSVNNRGRNLDSDGSSDLNGNRLDSRDVVGSMHCGNGSGQGLNHRGSRLSEEGLGHGELSGGHLRESDELFSGEGKVEGRGHRGDGSHGGGGNCSGNGGGGGNGGSGLNDGIDKAVLVEVL